MEPDRGCGSAPPGLEMGVDVGTLRTLLMEQSDRIRKSGDRVLREAMTKIQQRQEEYFALIEAKVQPLSDRYNSLECRLRMLEENQHFTETKEDAQDNLGTSGNEAPMTDGEKDISDVCGVENLPPLHGRSVMANPTMLLVILGSEYVDDFSVRIRCLARRLSGKDSALLFRNYNGDYRYYGAYGYLDVTVRHSMSALLDFYGLQADFQQVSDFLIHVAQTRGKLKRNSAGGGVGLDIPSAARAVITDWTTGKFRYYVLPPSSSGADAAAAEAETAEVVTSLAPALDIDALFSGQGAEVEVLGAPKEDDEDEDMGGSGAVEVDVAGMMR
ncbi:Guanine nucleotide-binding protein-like 3-like [Symbiodinium microadriaticum]|uniref:Guanine nucleotide-binding protein-like 3-like n=1 Tax=Symbiodinium microadriaticum TaxID=2951 RepID=A0A1Q9E7W2_SYMMI|nr:Guanine nucleotide-binding protein-like 3-like [Symbiodinium microadriaticum]